MRKTLVFPCLLLLALLVPGAAAAAGGIGLPNPASQFCVDTGGSLSILDGAGGQYGVCSYPSGLAVEEWTWYDLFFGGNR